ncbi:MAG TPA: glycosyltransferase 87 family protein, partial [Frankiaceae bacterium]|nr:glycosyltransferase 87 family protein [Frankiaceae bacterium]
MGAGVPLTAAWACSGLAALVGLVWVVYVHPIAHLDLDVFLGAGASVADGRDPYPVVGTPRVYSGFSFVYPYLVAWPFVPLSWLPHPVGAAVFVALSVLAVLAGCRLLAPRTAAVAAPVLAASWTITGLQMGTLNALLFLGLAALWRYRDRPVPAGLLAAALVVSKLFLWPPWLWLLLTRRTRAAAVAVGATAVVLGAGWLAGPLGAGSYLGMLSTLGVREAPAGLSLTGLLMNAGAGAGPAQWLARLAAVAVVVVAWRRVRRGTAQRAAGGTAGGA